MILLPKLPNMMKDMQFPFRQSNKQTKQLSINIAMYPIIRHSLSYPSLYEMAITSNRSSQTTSFYGTHSFYGGECGETHREGFLRLFSGPNRICYE